MKKNMGTADQVLRVLAALVIVILYFTDRISGTAAVVLLIVAGIFLVTGLISFCPLYWPFGISTRRKKK
ncbi:MAG: DUF2892 domain-containing protein [Bacteroidetes bacterium]|nr:DUF2892 domain-containing protein [Bacteroidota bacterium]